MSATRSTSILILEDDINMQELLVETLEDYGHHVQGAGCASDAIFLVKKFTFHLIITDVRMAGTDGIDALRIIKKFRPDIKAIVITGYADQTAPTRAIATEVDDYIYKPFRIQELLNSINRILQLDQERNRFQAIFNNLLVSSLNVVNKLRDEYTNKLIQTISRLRHKAYQALFIAIRSRHLTKKSALEIWDRLETLDRLASQSTPRDSERRHKLVEGYQYTFNLLSAMSGNRIGRLQHKRSSDLINKQEFYRLYENIQNGSVSLSRLMELAPLRQLKRSALSPEHPSNLLHHSILKEAAPSS